MWARIVSHQSFFIETVHSSTVVFDCSLAGAAGPVSAASEHLNIKVTDNNNEVFFKIKRTTKPEKLMNAFCERQGKSITSVRFLFNGQRVQPTDTPDALEMADGSHDQCRVGDGHKNSPHHGRRKKLAECRFCISFQDVNGGGSLQTTMADINPMYASRSMRSLEEGGRG
ncbi:hypothetical protein E4U41_001249 [Claviceps citrina]|nr:hypothetical protein E4U41_001249 [Claviceps citrina]